MGERPEVFRLEGVVRTFGGQPVLADINLRIVQGERVAIIGPSGAGAAGGVGGGAG